MNFFPPGALDSLPDSNAFRDRWYAAHLLAMRETPLYPPLADGADVYRLLFLPTFQCPVLVRLTHTTRGWVATCKQSDGHGGYGAGQLAREVEHVLSQAEVQELHNRLQSAAFWGMPSFEGDAGCDGSQVILEGVLGGRYHVVDRWSPHGTPYANLTDFILRLCPLDLHAEEAP